MSLFRGGERRAMDASWFGVDGVPSGSVTESRALCLTPYFAAIRHMVHYVSTLPVDFYRNDAPGKRTPVGPPELIRNVDAEIGLSTWLGQIMYGFATRGNAVGEVGAISGYNLPSMVRWAGTWSGGDDGPFWVNGRELPDRKVVHVPWGLVPPGKRVALDPVSATAAVIRAGLSAQEYADVQRGGGIPPALLKNTRLDTIEQEPARKIQAAAAKSFASGKPWVSGRDWELVFPTIPPNHAQFLETLKAAATAAASVFGLDPREVGGEAGESLTYTNDESRALNRAHNMRPYLVLIENAVSRLFPEKQYMKFNTDATIRTDLKTRTDIAIAEITNGIQSVNEYRARTDREPVQGGDFHNVPTPKSDTQTAVPTRTGDTQ